MHLIKENIVKIKCKPYKGSAFKVPSLINPSQSFSTQGANIRTPMATLREIKASLAKIEKGVSSKQDKTSTEISKTFAKLRSEK